MHRCCARPPRPSKEKVNRGKPRRGPARPEYLDLKDTETDDANLYLAPSPIQNFPDVTLEWAPSPGRTPLQSELSNDESTPTAAAAAATAVAAGARAGEGSARSENADTAGALRGAPSSGSAVADRAAAARILGRSESQLSNHYYTALGETPAIDPDSLFYALPTIGGDRDAYADANATADSTAGTATHDLAGPTADQVGVGVRSPVDDPDPAPPPR